MKKLAILILVISVLLSITSFGAKIDGEEIRSTVINGTTLAPLEDMARLLELDFIPSSEGYSVAEDNDTPRMLCFILNKPDKVYTQSYIKQKDGSLKLTDEQEVILPEKSVRIDGQLFVPYRFVMEYFGANVYWEAEKGAWAYRTSYGESTLIRTDGNVREKVSIVKGGFENAFFAGEHLVVIRGSALYRVNLENGEETLIGESGKVHIEGDKLFVLKSGKITMVKVATGENQVIAENVTMAGYLAEGGVWCDKLDGTTVYDLSGNIIAEITAEFANPIEYSGGYVYYLTPAMEFRRARPDGTEDEYLIKMALYPALIDGAIYYSDALMNYRRYDLSTGEDIMVYGLNLEKVGNVGEKYLFNFYSEAAPGLFIANPDGTEFASFGSGNVTVAGRPSKYKDGLAARGLSDDFAYYITEKESVKLTDDDIEEFLGARGDFVYYTVK